MNSQTSVSITASSSFWLAPMHRFRSHPSLLILLLLLLLSAVTLASPASAEPKWIRVSSSHFSVLTDTDEKHAREVVVRFEQLRSVFGQLLSRSKLHLSHPFDIIAVKSREEYSALAPVRDGRAIAAPGVFIAGEDRDYILLDLSEDQSWRAVSYDFGRMLMKYNYPPAQPWFDEGFAEYFASIRLDDRRVEIGSDPSQGYLLGSQIDAARPATSFTERLGTASWLSIPKLFAMKSIPNSATAAADRALFQAEAWIVMHYLIAKDKLAETGTYLELVENQKLGIDQATQKAYDSSPEQLEQAVKEYFRTISPGLQKTSQASTGGAISEFPTTIDVGNVGTSLHQILLPEAQALVAELAVRIPEHREQAMQKMQAIIDQPKLENAAAHRALGWAHLETKEYAPAREEFQKAIELDRKDAWARFQLSVLEYDAAQATGKGFQGLPNMMQDLRLVIDWKPDFADAYNLLALARLDGGGPNSALEAIRLAIQFSPRDQRYLFNLARIYMAAKKWDQAESLLNRLRSSDDAGVVRDATKTLADLPTLKKYGLLPQGSAKSAAVYSNGSSADDEDASSSTSAEAKPATPPPIDKRPVKFLKGQIVKIDCTQPPGATVEISSQRKKLRLRTDDYKSLQLIGADQFSCEWHDQAVAANYKPGGKFDGDLLSLELQ